MIRYNKVYINYIDIHIKLMNKNKWTFYILLFWKVLLNHYYLIEKKCKILKIIKL